MPSLIRLLRSHPERALFLGSVIIIALIVATSAYINSLRPIIGPRASVVSDTIEFSIGLNKTNFEQNEDVYVAISLTNISNKTMTISWSSYYYAFGQQLYFDFYVTGSNGSRVFQWSHFVAACLAATNKVLNPGEVLTNFYKWPQIYTDLPVYDVPTVPAGTYSVVGFTRAMALKTDSQTRISLETPSLSFSIE